MERAADVRAARSSARFDVTGGGRRSQLSVERDDDPPAATHPHKATTDLYSHVMPSALRVAADAFSRTELRCRQRCCHWGYFDESGNPIELGLSCWLGQTLARRRDSNPNLLIHRSRSRVRNDPLRPSSRLVLRPKGLGRSLTCSPARLIWLPGWLQNHHRHSQLGKPVNPLVRRCFQAQTWPFRGSFGGLSEGVGARGGPEKLIKMATRQRRRRVRHEPQRCR